MCFRLGACTLPAFMEAGRALSMTALVAAVVLAPRPAHARDAAGRTSSLAWVRTEGAETCIGGKALAEAVEGILGRSLFVSASAGDVAVEGQIAAAPGRGTWRATIRISDDHGTVLGRREIESPAADCRGIDESLAFVIAVMIDPDAAARAAAPVRSPPVTPPPVPVPVSAPPPPAPPSKPLGWEIIPTVGWTATIGILPSIASGPMAHVRVGRPIFGVELFGTFFLPQGETIPGASASVAFTGGLVGASACSAFAHVRSFGFLACAGVATEVLNPRPTGLGSSSAKDEVTPLAVARARTEWRFAPPFFAALSVGVDVPLLRAPYTYGEANASTGTTLFRPSPVFGTGDLGVGLFFR